MCLVSIAPRENVSDEKQIFNEKFYLSPPERPSICSSQSKYEHQRTRGGKTEKNKKKPFSSDSARSLCAQQLYLLFVHLFCTL